MPTPARIAADQLAQLVAELPDAPSSAERLEVAQLAAACAIGDALVAVTHKLDEIANVIHGKESRRASAATMMVGYDDH